MADTTRRSLQFKRELPGAGAPEAPAESNRCILVVDDDADITRFIGAVLASRGFRTVSAYDAMQGFLVAQKEQPRLIIVDWHMPAGGGAELLRKLRDSQQTASIPVVVVTSDSAPNLRQEAASLGARFFLHKPLDSDRLADLVAQFIA